LDTEKASAKIEIMNHAEIIDQLLKSNEPSVRWKVRVNVLGEKRESAGIRKLEAEIKDSPRVKALLQKMDKRGRMNMNIYAKW
jgi:hypothetical protein